MKKAILVLILVSICSICQAQKFVDGSELKNEKVNYCDVVLQDAITTNNVWINYGQSGKRSAFMVGEAGKKKKFDTFYEVIIYMDAFGWKFFKEHTEGNGKLAITHYIFRRVRKG